MNKKTKYTLIVIGFCIAVLSLGALAMAMQISLDTPASLPSDI